MKTKIQIKSIFGKILFEYESENNSVKKTLIKANLWEADLREADLRGTNLWEADLKGADLRGANLWGANLWGANLRRANLRRANLWEADLRRANLWEADLRGANLWGADLRGTNLWRADLREADFGGADLWGANLTKKQIQVLKHLFQIIPETGSFIAWKKGSNKCLIKIEIPEKAKRVCSFVGRKCRAEFIRVLEIWDGERKVKECGGWQHQNFKYRVGELIYPDSFDDNPLVRCSNGIHFFVTKQEAKNW